jgi:hypothetical protein
VETADEALWKLANKAAQKPPESGSSELCELSHPSCGPRSCIADAADANLSAAADKAGANRVRRR